MKLLYIVSKIIQSLHQCINQLRMKFRLNILIVKFKGYWNGQLSPQVQFKRIAKNSPQLTPALVGHIFLWNGYSGVFFVTNVREFKGLVYVVWSTLQLWVMRFNGQKRTASFLII